MKKVMNYILGSKKSFTIIEVLITIAISSVIIVSSMIIFFNVHFDNLNQRKFFVKYNEIDYVLSYMERDLSNAIDIEYDENNLKLVNYSYNDFSKNTKNQKIKNIKEITFSKNLVNGKVNIDRIAIDILNKNNDGKNRLISGVDDFKFNLVDNVINIEIKYGEKTYSRNIKLNNIERFKYE